MPWSPYAWPEDDPLFSLDPVPWVAHAKDLATWVTKGPNCDACQAFSGRTYPLAYWQATVMPGWHHKCDCRLSLAKAGVLESPHNLWGTEPYWWNPQQTPLEYIVSLLGRFLNFFSNRGKGDQYSGFDNLNPLFQSNTGFTNAGWTLLDYNIRPVAQGVGSGGLAVVQGTGSAEICIPPPVYGVSGIVSGAMSLLNSNHDTLFAKLPWEAPTTIKTPTPWQSEASYRKHGGDPF